MKKMIKEFFYFLKVIILIDKNFFVFDIENLVDFIY